MWTIDPTDDARLAIDELARESDRGAAIIAATLLEQGCSTLYTFDVGG